MPKLQSHVSEVVPQVRGLKYFCIRTVPNSKKNRLRSSSSSTRIEIKDLGLGYGSGLWVSEVVPQVRGLKCC